MMVRAKVFLNITRNEECIRETIIEYTSTTCNLIGFGSKTWTFSVSIEKYDGALCGGA